MTKEKVLNLLTNKSFEVDNLCEEVGENTEIGQRLVVLLIDIEGAIKDIKEMENE